MSVIHKSENRKNPRFACTVSAVLEGPRGVVRGTCRGISVGGLFFIGAALPIGRSFELKVELPAGRINVMAEVRYHHAYPEGAGMGLKFTRVTGDDLAKINSFIDSSSAA